MAADDDRPEIIFRLKLLPGVLNRKKGQLAKDAGGQPSDWSNWTKEDGDATIPRNRALELYRVHKVTMEYLYGGYVDSIADPELRRKLAQAERNAAVPAKIRKRA